MSTLNANSETTLSLPAGQALTIASPSGSSGLAVLLPRSPGGGPTQSVTQIAGSDVLFGPFARLERFEITCTTGTLTITANLVDPLSINERTPVNAVAATGKMVSSGSLATDDTLVTIGATVYTLKTTLSTSPDVPFEVLLGVASTNTAANLTAAINGAVGEGSTYATGTTPHPDVTATASSDDINLVADVKGVAGNAIVTTDDDAEITWDGSEVALVGGVDGTVGVENEICADASYIYHAIAVNTIAGANWRRITLGSVY